MGTTRENNRFGIRVRVRAAAPGPAPPGSTESSIKARVYPWAYPLAWRLTGAWPAAGAWSGPGARAAASRCIRGTGNLAVAIYTPGVVEVERLGARRRRRAGRTGAGARRFSLSCVCHVYTHEDRCLTVYVGHATREWGGRGALSRLPSPAVPRAHARVSALSLGTVGVAAWVAGRSAGRHVFVARTTTLFGPRPRSARRRYGHYTRTGGGAFWWYGAGRQ